MNQAAKRTVRTWTKDDLEQARTTSLAPILALKGYATIKLPNGAVMLRNFPGLLIHDNRWTWKNQHLYGNTLDFLTTIDGQTFAQAMTIIEQFHDDQNGEDSD